ncbi:MAG: hypothetical protein ACN6OB_04480 [Chryseobacterium jejuense]|uniref:hypothetical protein n=1 Tax=Chryseobacterium jejuense TaxID=445960 RepID=UPI003D120DE4
MKKNYFSASVLGALSLFFLFSCRVEDDFVQSNTPSEEKRFAAFWTTDQTKTVDFAKAFEGVLKDYGESSGKELYGVKPKSDGTYVDFNVFSQTVALPEGGYAVLFPVVKNSKTTDILIASIDKDAKKLGVNLLDKNVAQYADIFKILDERVHQNLNVQAARGTIHEIDPVVIPWNPNPGGGWGGGFGGGSGSGGGGGSEPTCSEVYRMAAPESLFGRLPPAHCIDPVGGGGSGTPAFPTLPPPDPCSRLKDQKDDYKYQSSESYLKTKLNDTSESGFRVGLPVPGSGQASSQYQQLSNTPGTNQLDFKIFNTTFGIMHSHYNGLIPIFSPGDVNLYIQLLKNAKNNNIPLNLVFVSVVTESGTYQLRGDNSMNVDALNMYTDAQITALNDTYTKSLGNANISTESLQQKFMDFLKENMNIPGMELYTVDENGNSKQLNENGTPTPCPN